ncbi:Hsp70 family protein [Plenodomus tracheiphilus IPT5]|uniref:Hsp70 family protein n=1 Tax=Plenodomus tracheiphilus IPT5 TaxID=1408161 RepID=A0A6A7B2U2_9PLEO|nr:Hsp70 family protein [Plenodomus tracheiphilus IPT5]
MPTTHLVVAVDFGTTYSGVAIAETNVTGSQAKPVGVIVDWPSVHTKVGTKEKVPTEIAYTTDGIRWVSDIPPKAARHMWMKLQLDRRQGGEADKILQEMESVHKAARQRPADIIADFLAQVRNHLVKVLDERYGPELWKSLPIVLVITVPAVWSDLAKNRTMQAFDKAGFNQIGFPQLARTLILSEPEAAAIFTIKTLRGRAQDEQLKVGDGIIICDMGGGTVDLTAYSVTGLQPTVIEEATVGVGDQCGATFVDRAFIHWLEDTLGMEDFLKIAGCRAKDVPHTSPSQQLGRILTDFIMEAKSGFSGNQHNFLRLPAPLNRLDDDDSRGICDGEIAISPDQMKSMFKSCIEKTFALLQEFICQFYIFLVGGFADSPYVYAQIKAFGERVGVTVIRPAYAWSAVVRGAAARGLEINGDSLVKFRKCRRYYGTRCSPTFNSLIHSELDAFIDEYNGTKRSGNFIEWLLRKGQGLSTTRIAFTKLQVRASFWPDEVRRANVDLIASDADRMVTKADDPAVYTVARLCVDFGEVPALEFRTMQSLSGRRYYEVDFSVEISVQSSLEFAVSVNGKRYGSLIAEYK